VLVVTALQLRHPFACVVCVKADDSTCD